MSHENTVQTQDDQPVAESTKRWQPTLGEIVKNPAYRDLVCVLALNQQSPEEEQIPFDTIDYTRLYDLGVLEGQTIMGKTTVTGELTAFGESVLRAISVDASSPLGDNGKFEFTLK